MAGSQDPTRPLSLSKSRLEPKQKLRATNGCDADFPGIATWSTVARF
jgi:hypothetical protein